MPLLFNEAAFPHGVGSTREMFFNEPGTGTEDVPQDETTFNWTVYCTANGNPAERVTRAERQLQRQLEYRRRPDQ